MRWFFLVFILLAVLFVGLLGLHGDKFKSRPIEVFPDMDDQYKLKYQRHTDFFADGRVSRERIPGTIPIGYALPTKPVTDGGVPIGDFAFDDYYYSTGLFGDFYGHGMPEQIEVNEQLLARGQERYAIYCAMCHGASGDGKGVVANYFPGAMLPPGGNIFNDKMAGRVAPLTDGQVFATITNGKGLMGSYGGNVPIPDRWAIVAYVRALRLSQNADVADPKVKAAFDAEIKRQAEEAKAEPKPETKAPANADGGDA